MCPDGNGTSNPCCALDDAHPLSHTGQGMLASNLVCKLQAASQKPGFVRKPHRRTSWAKRPRSVQVGLRARGSVSQGRVPHPVLCALVPLSSRTSCFCPRELSAPVAHTGTCPWLCFGTSCRLRPACFLLPEPVTEVAFWVSRWILGRERMAALGLDELSHRGRPLSCDPRAGGHVKPGSDPGQPHRQDCRQERHQGPWQLQTVPVT